MRVTATPMHSRLRAMAAPTSARPRGQGFSLIELMMGLVIAGILAAVAYPAFTAQLQRGRRADALAALTAVMQAQARHRSNASHYADALIDLGLSSPQITPAYQVSLRGIGTPASFSTGYVVTATPVAGGRQASDITCKSLTITLNGVTPTYTATGDPAKTGTDIDTSALCWPR